MNLINQLINIGCVQTGSFILKSGKKTNVYCDLRKIVSYPSIYRKIVNLINEKTILCDYDYIIGVPLSGILYSAPLACKFQKSLLVVRPPKEHGLKKEIEGVFEEGKECVIIEDVITSGKSILETIEVLNRNNLIVKNIITILDRQEGGVEKLTNLGYTVKSLFKLEDLLPISYPKKLQNCI